MRSIVFVHGFGGEFAKTWTPFQKELQSRPEAQNWAFHKYEYPTRRVRLPLTDIAPYINRLAQGLRTEIRNRCNMSTHLLLCGYSMGGLVIRKYLIEALKLGDELPPRMACLCYATPHNGSGLAQVARFLSKDNPPAEQMRPGSEFLKQLNSDWSNLEVEKRVKTRFVVAALDTTVDSESAQGEWGTKNVEVLIDRDHSTAVKPIDGKEDLSVFIAANLMRELCDADSATMPSGNWLIARFEGRFSEIDKEINRVIPKGILSPRAHKYVRFESKHLLQSLLALGMPVRIAFEVVEVISDELVGAAEKLSEVSTRELRSFVSDAIHGLAPRGADDTAVDQWISGYTARYGHSDGRLVVEKNGVSYPLDYTSLKNVIVPDVIFRITGKKLDQIDTEIISGSAIGRMARYVLKGVNNFGVYELNYNSLLLMATDIAVKRPHPWFVQRSGHSDTVTYDLERSHRWASELMHTVRSVPAALSNMRSANACIIPRRQYSAFTAHSSASVTWPRCGN